MGCLLDVCREHKHEVDPEVDNYSELLSCWNIQLCSTSDQSGQGDSENIFQESTLGIQTKGNCSQLKAQVQYI